MAAGGLRSGTRKRGPPARKRAGGPPQGRADIPPALVIPAQAGIHAFRERGRLPRLDVAGLRPPGKAGLPPAGGPKPSSRVPSARVRGPPARGWAEGPPRGKAGGRPALPGIRRHGIDSRPADESSPSGRRFHGPVGTLSSAAPRDPAPPGWRRIPRGSRDSGSDTRSRAAARCGSGAPGPRVAALLRVAGAAGPSGPPATP